METKQINYRIEYRSKLSDCAEDWSADEFSYSKLADAESDAVEQIKFYSPNCIYRIIKVTHIEEEVA